MFRQKKFLVGGLLVAAAIGYLGFMGLRGAASYYYTVAEFLSLPETPYEQSIRLNGTVAAGSIVRKGLDLEFTLVEGGAGDGRGVPVVYRGAVPDTFVDEANVVVEGSLGQDGVFKAKSILMKCPSKYEAEP